VLRVLPDVAGAGIPPVAWATTVASVAAWPREPVTPFVELRICRRRRRGMLRPIVVVGFHDPLELWSDAEAAVESRELARPLWSARPLPVASPAVARAITDPAVGYAAELTRLDGRLPEGPGALLPLYQLLVEGLAALDGPVALSMLVLPPVAHQDVEEGRDNSVRLRHANFLLRLFAARPIPATLRARAEALCLAHRAVEGDWCLAVTPVEVSAAREAISEHRPLATQALPPARCDIVALTLALPLPADPSARTAVGRQVAGPLPQDGPVLGRAPRSDGRFAPWRLAWAQRRLHTFIAGASGCGKSTATLRLALDDLEAGRSIVLVDFHGDLGDQLAAVVPADRLVHVDPRRSDTAALDLLDGDPARASAHLLSAVSEVWPADYAGPAWHRSISLATRALARTSLLGAQPTLADVERFIVDAEWRGEIVADLDDIGEIVADLADVELLTELRPEHEAWCRPSRDDTSMVNWVSSKLTPLTRGPGRSLFTAPAGERLEATIARGAVLVVVLPVGTLGQATASLTARMFLARLTAAIAVQGDLPEDERHPVAVFVDEAHLAAGPALAGLFAQARKFNCAVTIACQSPSQMEPHLDQLLTNTQTHLYGRLSQRDAMSVAARVGECGARALPCLPRHHLLVVLEDNDPELEPLVLAPVAPPALPTPVPRPAASAAVAPVVAEPAPARARGDLDDALDALLSARRRSH
jgi:hypothetical protein